MVYVCSKTSVSVIVNGFVEVSHTDRKVIWIGFDNDIYRKLFLIGAVDISIYLLNGTIIDQTNYTLIPYGGTK